MTSPIVGTAGNPALNSVPSRSDEINREDFLQLLVTQLRHQDPLNPMDAAAFSSQLAEFSSLEQLIQLTDQFDRFAEASGLMALSINTDLAASLLGREVLAVGNGLEVTDSGDARLTVDVGGVGGAGRLRVVSADGQEVFNDTVGFVGSGRQTIAPDDLELPPGTYTYELTVTGVDQSSVAVTHFTRGQVNGIQFDNGVLKLRIGTLSVALNQLVEIGIGDRSGE